MSISGNVLISISGNVLITGCGTLTKAILTVAKRESWPARFTVYSRSELTQSQVRSRFPDARFVIGDVRDYERLEAAIAGHDIVIHGAAMKRIPECEQQPDECWKTNVLGSSNVARACNATGVSRCVGISTDKACRATTMYGASKLALEKIFRAQTGSCVFTLVRYGNVVASRGSVVEIWRRQFSAHEALTITDPDMTRFFMSPFDAVALIEGALGVRRGEVVVGKMKAISMGALQEGVFPRVKTQVIGLRSEEKAHEDLIHENEKALELQSIFLLAKDGTLGHYYNSEESAPRLTPDEFLAMLRDSEALDA